eukprot:gene9653-7501_t
MREAVLNLGLCHYMVAIKRPCGTVLQYDFGPQGGRDVGTSRSKSGLPAEVRETRLPGGIPTNVHALYVGKTMMDLDHIREFNSLQPKYYALYESDWRHYANGLVQLLTGTERSTAQYLRHRYIERMAAGDPQGAWHQGLYNVAHMIADAENWRDEGVRSEVLAMGAASARLATAAVAAVPLCVAGRNALATGIASSMVSSIPRIAFGSLQALPSGYASQDRFAPPSLAKTCPAIAASVQLVPRKNSIVGPGVGHQAWLASVMGLHWAEGLRAHIRGADQSQIRSPDQRQIRGADPTTTGFGSVVATSAQQPLSMSNLNSGFQGLRGRLVMFARQAQNFGTVAGAASTQPVPIDNANSGFQGLRGRLTTFARHAQTLGTVAGNRIAGVFARFMPRTERLQATIPTTSRALTLASPQSQLVSTNSLFSSLRTGVMGAVQWRGGTGKKADSCQKPAICAASSSITSTVMGGRQGTGKKADYFQQPRICAAYSSITSSVVGGRPPGLQLRGPALCLKWGTVFKCRIKAAYEHVKKGATSVVVA